MDSKKQNFAGGAAKILYLDNKIYDWMGAIRSGKKQYEGRLLPKAREFQAGDIVEFRAQGQPSITVRVLDVEEFRDFGEAYDKLGSQLVPGTLPREAVIDMYNQYNRFPDEKLVPGASSQKVQKYGVGCIKIEVI